ncbi:MAG: hypothetical protein QM535_03740 [Limnohabitans sp.]|nr:hypothetical protein [Limnohabitans sp.]
MKKTALLLLFLIAIVFKSNAHKDISVYEKYGNVKVYLRTGFNYSDIEKIKIIGKLSEKLCAKLTFKDTLFVEYIQDYVDNYSKDIYKFENNTNWSFRNGLDSISNSDSITSGISLRIIADKINISNVLSLVEYAITHQNDLSKKLMFQNVIDRWSYNEQEKEIKLKAIPDDLLAQIFTYKSVLLQEIISLPIYIKTEEFIGIQTYWKNDKFTFEYKFHDEPLEKLFEIEDYFYSINLNNESMLIFISQNQFYYIKPSDDNNSKLLEVKCTTYVPFTAYNIFRDKIVLYNGRNDPTEDFYILLKDKRKIISKFE